MRAAITAVIISLLAATASAQDSQRMKAGGGAATVTIKGTWNGAEYKLACDKYQNVEMRMQSWPEECKKADDCHMHPVCAEEKHELTEREYQALIAPRKEEAIVTDGKGEADCIAIEPPSMGKSKGWTIQCDPNHPVVVMPRSLYDKMRADVTAKDVEIKSLARHAKDVPPQPGITYPLQTGGVVYTTPQSPAYTGPPAAKLACPKYQHVEHWPGPCGPAHSMCDGSSIACEAVAVCAPPPPDECVDNVHEVTEREWQQILRQIADLQARIAK